MAIVAGQIKQVKINGVNYDPIDTWTIRESGFKRDVVETTRTKAYFSKNPQEAMITGQIINDTEIDYDDLFNAEDVPVLIEGAGGDVYSGRMTYTADRERALNDGKVQVEMKGTLKRQ